jgi:FkbH-like protein
MNLRKRQPDIEELGWWLLKPGNRLLTFRVSDRFGDAGLTGIVGLHTSFDEEMRATLTITDFILSCRVMGRLVEEAMVKHVVNEARASGVSRIVAEIVPTAKNEPCQDFWRDRSGFERDGNVFSMGLT